MLKITETARNESGRSFKLEGKLLGPWVDELRNVCIPLLDRLEQVGLDLAGVTYVNPAGAKLLCELVRQGIIIIRISAFVENVMHVEEP